MTSELINIQIKDNGMVLIFDELQKKVDYFDTQCAETQRKNLEMQEKIISLEKEITNQNVILKSVMMLSKEVTEIRDLVNKLNEEDAQKEKKIKQLQEQLEIKTKELDQIKIDNENKTKEVEQIKSLNEKILNNQVSFEEKQKRVESENQKLDGTSVNNIPHKIKCLICQQLIGIDSIISHIVEHVNRDDTNIKSMNNEIQNPPVIIKPSITNQTITPSSHLQPIIPSSLSTGPAIQPSRVDSKPVENKPIESKPVKIEPKVVEIKLIEPKVVEIEPIESKPIEIKPIEPKPVEIEPIKPKVIENKPIEPQPVKIEPIKPKVVKIEPSNELLECPVCCKKFPISQIESHVNKHFCAEEPTFACPFCGLDMGSSSKLQKHVSQAHSREIK
ncbi:zinc finger, c2h2 type domain containing protein [Entamoeba nuttalli P19]|uniref:Zinc finger, c2h2 type domain containing protein n=1 Tax=Entamoeba nuttalli (strain P19) TaxID=1076696 RepID=K2H110_ENTNP|nr:zinc finger, c2h2 type domain containing protein [Entamoeba nuttalli P19]EKE41168.1 zinc finger, c2h2 type domain containing protein [Entamoeba nuttalli P19]|eukprot:XP_008856476.1 zinc finger, c2h2 type domain containing protein [Entamoeba nuttalli P19]